MSVQRWDCVYEEMEERADGDFVTYEDHLAEVERVRAEYVNPNCVWAEGECVPDCPTCKYLDESYADWCRAHSAGMLEGLSLAESKIYEALQNASEINGYGAYLIIKDIIKKVYDERPSS